MPEALGMLSENFSPRMSNIYMLIAFFSGTSFIALIDFLIPEDENPHESTAWKNYRDNNDCIVPGY